MKNVILAGEGEFTNILYNEISKHFPIDRVIVEAPVPKGTFIKRRIKKLGLPTVLGQISFKVMIEPYLFRRSISRINEILKSVQSQF
jgi:phosphosulfolactate synthase (CoM biosynthesis protein A)